MTYGSESECATHYTTAPHISGLFVMFILLTSHLIIMSLWLAQLVIRYNIKLNLSFIINAKHWDGSNELASGSCFVELRSWGGADSSKIGYASINQDTQANYTHRDVGEVRGFNTQLIRSTNCTAYDSRHFDTGALNSASVGLANYIQSLPSGTILYGVTCDDARSSLSDHTIFILMANGVDVSWLVQRGKLTFVAVIGRPEATVLNVASDGGENLMTTAIITRAVEDLTGRNF